MNVKFTLPDASDVTRQLAYADLPMPSTTYVLDGRAYVVMMLSVVMSADIGLGAVEDAHVLLADTGKN